MFGFKSEREEKIFGGKRMKQITKILKSGKISSLTSANGSGTTGEAHLAEIDGKKYLLRICPNKKTADWYFLLYHLFERYNIMPKLIDSGGKYLLFEFIEGRDLKKKENPKIIYEVGRLCAIVNKQKYEGEYKDKFKEKLREITDKKIISGEKSKQVENLFDDLSNSLKIELSLDIGDATSDNFRLSKDGKIYFVDIEAIKYHMKGMCVAKAFYQWFRTPEERKIFLEGYESEHSTDFLTKDYLKLCYLIFLIQRIRFKFNKGETRPFKKALEKLDELLRGEEL